MIGLLFLSQPSPALNIIARQVFKLADPWLVPRQQQRGFTGFLKPLLFEAPWASTC
jgi:hypothetical protein